MATNAQRVDFLEQQVKDLEQHLRHECEASVKKQIQLMQQIADLGKSLQLKEATTNYLQQQLNEALGAYRTQRQRADQMQLENRNKAVQNQRDQALKEHIQRQEQQIRQLSQRAEQLQLEVSSKSVQGQKLREHTKRLEQQIREQQEALSEFKSRLLEQQTIHERLQVSLELLKMRMEDKNAFIKEERSRQGDRLPEVQEKSAGGTYNKDERDAVLQNDIDKVQVPMARTDSDEPENQVLSERFSEQLREFEQERAQLLEQASDAVVTQQNVTLEYRSYREAALTCPISRGLFVDPVVTECCGKTFSSEALMQSLERNSICPICRENEVRFHPNRDMSILVELHRSGNSTLDDVSSNQPASCIEDDITTTEPSDVPVEREHRSRGDSDDVQFSPRPRHQERRSQRLQDRSATSRRKSTIQECETPAAAPAQNSEPRRQTRSSTLRRQRSPRSDAVASSAQSGDPLNDFASWLGEYGRPGARRRIARYRQSRAAHGSFSSWNEFQQVVGGNSDYR